MDVKSYYTEENLNTVTLSETQAMDILALMEQLRTNGNHDDKSLRFAEAVIAQKAGYHSREEWTSELKHYLNALDKPCTVGVTNDAYSDDFALFDKNDNVMYLDDGTALTFKTIAGVEKYSKDNDYHVSNLADFKKEHKEVPPTIYSISQYGFDEYYKTDKNEKQLIMYYDNAEVKFADMRKMGEQISVESYAELQQSGRVTSLEFNIDANEVTIGHNDESYNVKPLAESIEITPQEYKDMRCCVVGTGTYAEDVLPAPKENNIYTFTQKELFEIMSELDRSTNDFYGADEDLISYGDKEEIERIRYQESIEGLTEKFVKVHRPEIIRAYQASEDTVTLYQTEDKKHFSFRPIKNNGMYDDNAKCTKAEYTLPNGYELREQSHAKYIVNSKSGESVVLRNQNGIPAISDDNHLFFGLSKKESGSVSPEQIVSNIVATSKLKHESTDEQQMFCQNSSRART